MTILALMIAALITGAVGSWVAKEKGRDRAEGFLLGLFLSIPGLIIEGLLPTQQAKPPRASGGPRFEMVGEKREAKAGKKSILRLS